MTHTLQNIKSTANVCVRVSVCVALRYAFEFTFCTVRMNERKRKGIILFLVLFLYLLRRSVTDIGIACHSTHIYLPKFFSARSFFSVRRKFLLVSSVLQCMPGNSINQTFRSFYLFLVVSQQTFLDITNDPSSSVPCQAGFVPPLPLFSTFEQESQDHSLGSTGSNSSESWQTPPSSNADQDTSTEATESK